MTVHLRARRLAAVAVAVSLAALAWPSYGASTAADPLRPRQWGLDQVRAPKAWQVAVGRGVLVAVLDSGVARGHPDLRGQVLPGKDMLTGHVGQTDGCGHGTQVAGIIAARRNNGIGIAGVAPQAHILPLKIGQCIDVDGNAVIAAIRYATSLGAQVINLSESRLPLTGPVAAAAGFEEGLQKAIDDAWARGALVVGSAGNFTIPLCSYPGLARHALCVGAVDRNGARSYYSEGSNLNTDSFLVAPGGGPTMSADDGIWTTTITAASDSSVSTGSAAPFPGYDQVEGTSFAAPYVSGVAALLFSRGLSVSQVRRRLLDSARDLGPAGPDALYGAGIVDASAALARK